VQRASSRPPPRARDETALMVGIGREDNSANVPLKFSKKFAVLFHTLSN
jgi:hypothetical protein